MLGLIDEFRPAFSAAGIALTCPVVRQTLTIEELAALVPDHDGWIIGDDPASQQVLEVGRAGRLRAAVKRGVGVDNVDYEACSNLGIRICNTPGAFGSEVADLALGYVIALARQTHLIDRGVRAGEWLKPPGISLAGKHVAVIGYGDIGRHLCPRLRACGMEVTVYDPAIIGSSDPALKVKAWPQDLGMCDFIVVTCALTDSSRHLLNSLKLSQAKPEVRLVNVSRGSVVQESALLAGLESGHVHSAALDVFETEPLPPDSPLLKFDRCIFGSHNASNTVDAVRRASRIATTQLIDFLRGLPA
jgi:D-3-phosphoglycerate dehydrogenase